MREILFRAKTASTDNPEWVEGCYTFDGTHWIERMSEEYPGHTESIPIDPETLGQFTGLYDKNGARVFEGDIVKHYDDIGKVYWDKDACVFFIRDYNTGLPDNLVLPCALHSSCTYEVIGNIYDNRELLKGAQNDA